MSKTSKTVKARYREKHRKELRAKGRAYYRHNPRKHKNNWLRRRYGMTIEEYDALVVAQSNCCAICKQPEKAIHWASGKIKPLSVDHNHVTGKPRALLCFKCNYTVGIIEASTDRLKAFQQYLETWDLLHGIMVH